MTTNQERGQPGQGDTDHPANQIEEEHRSLRRQLEIIAGADTNSALLSGVLHLPKTLSEHFAREEQIGGLYDDLQARRPSIARELDALRAEHRVILDEFETLNRKLTRRIDEEGMAEKISQPVIGAVDRCVQKLLQHEREESRVIGDVYYTDEGGLG